ncbi:MAG: multidrug resistance efflux pump [Xanthomonadaceae bacterium]|nr:multidrug resistance efflux pump [Xanthomonadaceae bacterium]
MADRHERVAMRRCLLALAAAFVLTACSAPPTQALGTLEYDRVTLPAPAAERVASVQVHEGERVHAGQSLLRLEVARTLATTQAAQAQVQQQREALAELQAGPRTEAIAQARAQLMAAQAQARDAQAYFARLQPLGRRQLVAAADVDRARAAAGNADAQVKATQAALAELEHGTRSEQLGQGIAALQASQAQAAAQAITLDKLDITAPRDGVVDSIPYKLGDQAPVGAPLAVLLVGSAPYARIYVPEQQRANVHVGDRVQVQVAGREKAFAGRIRSLRSEPGFTPYYALVGKDAARLSYLAEVQLGRDASELPAGLPVKVQWPR